MLEPFQYQVDAVVDLRDARGRKLRRLLLCMLMGAGKTVVALEIMRGCQEKGFKSLFLCDRRMLADQVVERAREQGLDCGIIMSGRGTNLSAPCQFASKQTVEAWLKSGKLDLPEFNLIVVDECHRAISPKWLTLFARWPNATLIGLTATPCLGNGDGMGAYYDYLCQPIKPSELLALGRNVKVRAFAPHVPDLKGVKKDKDGDYQAKSLSERMTRKNLIGDVAGWWKKLADNRPSIYFACDVAHAMSIRDEFREQGVTSEIICDETPDEEREEIKRLCQLGTVKVVVNCDVLCEGVDWPFVEVIGLVRPTKRLRRFLQAAGRGMRASPGKSECLIIDHAGCILYHGFPDIDRIWPLSPDDNVDKMKENKPSNTMPIVCKICSCLFTGTRVCPQCGELNAPPRVARDAARGNGTLVEATRHDLPPEIQHSLYQKYWPVCIGRAIKLNRKAGMAAGMFSGKFGLPPWEAKVHPLPEYRGAWQRPACEVFPGFVRNRK